MAEITFAKQYLAQLDARSVRLSSDWVGDARKLPAQAPFTLPNPPVPFPKPTDDIPATNPNEANAATSATSSVSVILQPLRGDPTTISINSTSSTSIYDLKTQCAKKTGYAPDKIKILWERRPVPDAKLLAEVVGKSPQDPLQLGVIFVGQPTQPTRNDRQDTAPSSTPVAQVPSGIEVIQSPAFWSDLEAFVVHRVRDEKVGKEAVESWKKASQGAGI